MFKIAIFSLNQWALDFKGNTTRILKSIDLAKEQNASYRAGPELEICGYSVEDAFFESDTVYHSWLSLLKILKNTKDVNMIIDLGMPVHFNSLYNCRVIVFKGRIICIRAKTSLAKDGNYREDRYFTPWKLEAGLTAFRLPEFVSSQLNQDCVPFGADYILEICSQNRGERFRIGWEICQELWDLSTVSSNLYQNFGCHLIVNGSGSYWELRKLHVVHDLITGTSLRGGACYAFSNHVGCDGQRYVFYGRSCIFDKGQLVAMTPTNSEIFEEIQMITHVIDSRSINEYRAQVQIKPDPSKHAAKVWDLRRPNSDIYSIDNSYKILHMNESFNDLKYCLDPKTIPSPMVRYEEEINVYVSLWLWDYLRRSKMKGFMLPLSGGLDSSCVAILVYGMCQFVLKNLHLEEVQMYFRDVHNMNPDDLCSTLSINRDICKRLLKCSYLSTNYSGKTTLNRAKYLCESIGAEFVELSIQDVYSKFRHILPVESKDDQVSLLDQNLQARIRMTATYYLSGGNRIVLATGNVDEAIVGYLTKYDCSSADINPIGGLCKDDLKGYLNYCCHLYEGQPDLVAILKDIIDAPPSAELTGTEQRDEDEIGITYSEIAVLGRVRRGVFGCSGPLGAFELIWNNRHIEPFSKIRCLDQRETSPFEKATKLSELVKRFYSLYARNRHKLTVLTPSLHAETYSPDDNRFDHRHFLYAPWTEQFKAIDEKLADIKRAQNI